MPRDLTRNQKLVHDRLATAPGPLTAYALLDDLRGEGFRAPLQVYRALDSLISGGLVHRLESLNAFVACTCGHGHGEERTAFAICEDCGKTEEFSGKGLSAELADWIGARAFSPRRTVIEIRGRCGKCIDGPAKAPV